MPVAGPPTSLIVKLTCALLVSHTPVPFKAGGAGVKVSVLLGVNVIVDVSVSVGANVMVEDGVRVKVKVGV